MKTGRGSREEALTHLGLRGGSHIKARPKGGVGTRPGGRKGPNLLERSVGSVGGLEQPRIMWAVRSHTGTDGPDSVDKMSHGRV